MIVGLGLDRFGSEVPGNGSQVLVKVVPKARDNTAWVLSLTASLNLMGEGPGVIDFTPDKDANHRL